MKARPHSEIIKAWADGAEIQYRAPGSGVWKDCPEPAWVSDYEYRVKPEEPKRRYPETALTSDELCRVSQESVEKTKDWSNLGDVVRYAIANAALRHACDNGQVVTREEFDRAVGDRKARDLAVAEAVKDSILGACAQTTGIWALPVAMSAIKIDLAAIIAEVGK